MNSASVTKGTDFEVLNLFSTNDCSGIPGESLFTSLSGPCSVNDNNGVSSNKYDKVIHGLPSVEPGTAYIKLYSSTSSCVKDEKKAVQWAGEYQLNTCILDSGSTAKAFIYYCTPDGITQRQFTTASSCTGSYSDNLFLPTSLNGYTSTCNIFIFASDIPIGAGYVRGFCKNVPNRRALRSLDQDLLDDKTSGILNIDTNILMNKKSNKLSSLNIYAILVYSFIGFSFMIALFYYYILINKSNNMKSNEDYGQIDLSLQSQQ